MKPQLYFCFKYYVTLLMLSSPVFAGEYSFPNTGLKVVTKAPLYTDEKTGGFTPKDQSFQALAFEFDQKQANNLSVKAITETWKKAGHTIISSKDTEVLGFWGTEVLSETTSKQRQTSYYRHLLFGDFNKLAQVSIMCGAKDANEQCKGADQLVKGLKWSYEGDKDLSSFKSKILLPPPFKLYIKVQTKNGPVHMYTEKARPMSEDGVATLTISLNKGIEQSDKYLINFGKSIDLVGLSPKESGITSKRTKNKFVYAWGTRPGSKDNYYISCGVIEQKSGFQLIVCATGNQKNYELLHKSLFKMASTP